MIILKRFLPFVTALLLLGGMELLLRQKGLFWFFASLLIMVTAFATGSLLEWKIRSGEFWHLFLLGIGFIASSLFLLIFLTGSWTSHGLVAITAILGGWYLENLFLFRYQQHRYQPYALENIASYLNLLTIFYLASSLSAVRIFLSVSLFILIPIGTIVALLLSLQVLWSSKVAFAKAWVLLVVYGIIMFELFGAVSVLPTTFFVAGLLLSIPHYLMMNLARYSFRGLLNRKVAQRYAFIGFAVLAITLFTAPWR